MLVAIIINDHVIQKYHASPRLAEIEPPQQLTSLVLVLACAMLYGTMTLLPLPKSLNYFRMHYLVLMVVPPAIAVTQ